MTESHEIIRARWPIPPEFLLALDGGDRLAPFAIADWLEENGIPSGWREACDYWPSATIGRYDAGKRFGWCVSGRRGDCHWLSPGPCELPRGLFLNLPVTNEHLERPAQRPGPESSWSSQPSISWAMASCAAAHEFLPRVHGTA